MAAAVAEGQGENTRMMIFPEKHRHLMEGTEFESFPGARFGVFYIPRTRLDKTKVARAMKVIATDGDDTDWEHVSVSLVNQNTCPSWDEMARIKKLFWEPEDCVVEFHVGKSDHVSHAEVLHLWRYKKGPFPQPPKEFV
jgi:hypothetical protein